jgi:hypothetical protein
MGIVGILGFLTHQPLLFPSLGPTIFLHTTSPDGRSSTTWNTLAGHGIGLVTGLVSLFIFSAHLSPAIFEVEVLPLARIGATALAVGATVGFQLICNVQHPPAAATTMLITLGGLKPDWRTLSAVCTGVLLVSIIGWLFRRGHRRMD